MNLYKENDYFNLDDIYKADKVFNIAIGGRGTGKTFNTLDFLIENNISFLFLRRSLTQLELITSTDDMSPIEPVANTRGFSYEIQKINKYLFKIIVNDEFKGYMSALNTFANLRGFDMSNIKVLVFDEFIPEKGEKVIKNENAIFFNAYETINRNRELKGEKPLKVFLLSNANTLDSLILDDFGVINYIYKMQKTGQELYIDEKKSILFANLKKSKISELKSQTALYKAQNNRAFNDMAIANDFLFDDNDIKSCKINCKNFVTSIDDVAIYDNGNQLYFCKFKKQPCYNSNNDIDKLNIRVFLYPYRKRFLKKQCLFSTLEIKLKVFRLFDL